jgi:hypothetical protein
VGNWKRQVDYDILPSIDYNKILNLQGIEILEGMLKNSPASFVAVEPFLYNLGVLMLTLPIFNTSTDRPL